MRLAGKFILASVFPSTKNANVYTTLTDVETGGQVKVTSVGALPGLDPAPTINEVVMEISPRLFGNTLNLEVTKIGPAAKK